VIKLGTIIFSNFLQDFRLLRSDTTMHGFTGRECSLNIGFLDLQHQFSYWSVVCICYQLTSRAPSIQMNSCSLLILQNWEGHDTLILCFSIPLHCFENTANQIDPNCLSYSFHVFFQHFILKSLLSSLLCSGQRVVVQDAHDGQSVNSVVTIQVKTSMIVM
jgi:hypothetical protein